MGSKRKYDPDGDYSEPKPRRSRKRSRRNSYSDEDSDFYEYASVRKRKRLAPKSRHTEKRKKQKTSIQEEREDLADYNRPPVSQYRITHSGLCVSENEDEHTPNITRATRKSAKASRQHYTQGGRVAKPRAKTPRVMLTEQQTAVRELADLAPWGGVWVSGDKESSGGNKNDDNDEERKDDSHGLNNHPLAYPPKASGVQNIPWKGLPAEIRNSIYQYAMADEGEKVLNIRHYPNGVPRRSARGTASASNFSQSYWGLTQVCKQTRNEFMLWLLTKRRVRTPLATLKHYIDTFHRPGAGDRRIGWVEPICCGAPLPGDGVEVLELLRNNSPSFHLQLTPTTVSEVLDALVPPPAPDAFDELKIMQHMQETVPLWGDSTTLKLSGIEGIYITSIVKDSDGYDVDICDDEDVQTHEILIKFNITQNGVNTMPFEERLRHLNSFIFGSKIAEKKGVKLEADFPNTITEWEVSSSGTLYLELKDNGTRALTSLRKLTFAPSETCSYTEEELY